MKHVASLILAAGLCACSGRPADDATPKASDAATPAAEAGSATPKDAGNDPDVATDAAKSTEAKPADATNAPPAGGQGIAVGEPNPSAPGGFQPPVPGPSPGSGLAHFDGYGDMKFGMDEAAARKAWAGELNGKVQGDMCTYLNPKNNKSMSYFAFMFEGGKFVRYDVGNDKEVAPGGGRRGMTAAEIQKLYAGRVQASPHHYVKGGQYLKVRGEGGAIVFETDAKGVVTEWHAGVEPQVNYIEGCS
jgi:hypothetical protein